MLLHARSGFLPMGWLDGEQLSTELRPLGVACCCTPAVASCRWGGLMGSNSALKSGRWGGMLLHARSGFLPMGWLDGEQLSTEIRPLGWHAAARPQWLLVLLHARSGFLPMGLLDGEQLSTEIRPLGLHAVARPQWLLPMGLLDGEQLS